jgi:hypothetical protein
MVDSPRRPSGQSIAPGPSQDATHDPAIPVPPPSDARNVRFRPVRGPQQSSIGLRRLRSNTSRLAPPEGQQQRDNELPEDSDGWQSQMSRSSSTPELTTLDSQADPGPPACRMPSIPEGTQDGGSLARGPTTQSAGGRSALQRSLQEEYDPRIVDILDAIGKWNEAAVMFLR